MMQRLKTEAFDKELTDKDNEETKQEQLLLLKPRNETPKNK
jgi:hypothetical protein